MTFRLPPEWFSPRPYQLEFLQALDRGIRKHLLIWPRRYGKDVSSLMGLSKFAHRTDTPPGQYWYLFPEKEQARRAIWDGRTREGHRYIDVFPRVTHRLEREMRLRFMRPDGQESQFLVEDADPNSLVGAPPAGIVISEFAVMRSGKILDYMRPILTENNGLLIVNSTVRGYNHLHHLWRSVRDDPEWHVSYHTAETGLNWDGSRIVTQEMIEREIAQGMSRTLAKSEYMNQWDAESEGAFYAQELSDLMASGGIGSWVWNPAHKVHTAWDLGMSDLMIIWFFQVIDGAIHIIDFEMGNGLGMLNYFPKLNQGSRRRYHYGYHFVPHDINVRELMSGDSRLELAAQQGFMLTPVRKTSIASGIELVRSILPICKFDSTACANGLESLKRYQRTPTDFVLPSGDKMFSEAPLKNGHQHAADAFRYLAVAYNDYLKHTSSKSSFGGQKASLRTTY